MFSALTAHPFRLFFLLTGIYGLVVVLAWVAYLFGGLALPLGWSPLHWHSHEMLFGLISAAIAGFILTAVCNWTGAPPLHGKALLLLASLWVFGRLVFWFASDLPLWVVALVDMLFLPALGLILMRTLIAYGNKRNLVLGGVILLLAAANLMMHIGLITSSAVWLSQGELLGLNLIMLLMLIIGGRIIPLFSTNWLRNHGISQHPVSYPWLDKSSLLLAALVIPADAIGLPWLTGSLALAAAITSGLRLAAWNGWRCWPEPLLWVLHIGYAWIVVALLFKGLAAFALVPPSAWQHALGTGAMGTLVLGIMTRVALGHTGRPLQLPTYAWLIYAGITLAALARVCVALGWMDYRWGILLAATGWCLAFLLFVLLYWPILSRPRIDGRPG